MELQGILLKRDGPLLSGSNLFEGIWNHYNKPKNSYLSSIRLLYSLHRQVVGSMYLQPTVGLSKQNIVWQSTGKWSVGYVDLEGIKI